MAKKPKPPTYGLPVRKARRVRLKRLRGYNIDKRKDEKRFHRDLLIYMLWKMSASNRAELAEQFGLSLSQCRLIYSRLRKVLG